MKLVRKVDLARWQELATNVPEDDVSSDFVTAPKRNELKTINNALSLWRFDPVDGEWQNEAALVLAGETPDSLSIAWIEEELVLSAGISVHPSPGVTVFKPLSDRHVDLVHLGSARLSTLARFLASAARTDGNFRAFTRDEVLQLFARAIHARRIKLPHLPQTIQSAVAPLVASTTSRPPDETPE